MFPRPKILVVLFRNDDQTWEVKGEKRTSENRRKIRGGSRIFLRRGCTLLLLYFNTNKPHSFFCCRIPVVLENRRSSRGGEGGAHPQHPPSRSAPEINGLKASKNWDEWKLFILKFFSRAIEISRQFCTSSNSFFTEKIHPLRRSLPHVWKRSKSPMNVLNSGLLVGLRFKNMRFLNKCSTLR